ncbi:MAG: TetR/AcrR family transcriptional regulator [Rhodococcus sp. (in: high G+C Gram-positive bacteria)]
MAVNERRERERDARRQMIVAAARTVAEAEGWDAVTTRRLSAEIEYSQPVLYKHFAGMDQIADAVATTGFGELTDALRDARSDTSDNTLTRVGHAYLIYARDHVAVYDAMFTRPTSVQFAAEETPPERTAAFAELRRSIEHVAEERDSEMLTEVFWAALHGLVTLTRTGRLRPGHEVERLELLVEQFTD